MKPFQESIYETPPPSPGKPQEEKKKEPELLTKRWHILLDEQEETERKLYEFSEEGQKSRSAVKCSEMDFDFDTDTTEIKPLPNPTESCQSEFCRLGCICEAIQCLIKTDKTRGDKCKNLSISCRLEGCTCQIGWTPPLPLPTRLRNRSGREVNYKNLLQGGPSLTRKTQVKKTQK